VPSSDPVEAVLDAVASIPAGRVMSYGDVAEYVSVGSPRMVGAILSRYGGGVPWHRVLRSDGRPAPHLRAEQLRLLRAEGAPLQHDGERVDMRRARWDGN
jgi:methylated-DNA-protein-cysteine methyltransferase-like protein